MRNRILRVALLRNTLNSPSPRSFHSLVSEANLKSLLRSENRTSSSSSPVFT